MGTALTVVLWIVGIIVALVVVVVLLVIVVPMFFRKPEKVAVSVESPGTCKLGDTFKIRVRVTDTSGQPRLLSSVDLTKDYLRGIVVESIDPKPAESSSMLGSNAYYVRSEVPPNGVREVVLSCKATQAGDYSGSLLVYVDKESGISINNVVRTVVMA
jgi:uncharacterized protein (DUF58 family)